MHADNAIIIANLLRSRISATSIFILVEQGKKFEKRPVALRYVWTLMIHLKLLFVDVIIEKFDFQARDLLNINGIRYLRISPRIKSSSKYFPI